MDKPKNSESGVINLAEHIAKIRRKPKPENIDVETDISDEEIKFNQRVEALGSLFTAAEALIEDISILALKVGANGEKEIWQDFLKKWKLITDLYETFWEEA